MNKEQQKVLEENEKYKNKLLSETYKIIKDANKKYKLLNKKERELLRKYKNLYYQNINNYLITNKVKYHDFINHILNNYYILQSQQMLTNQKILNKKQNINNKKSNINNKKQNINNESNISNDKVVVNVSKLIRDYKKNLKKDIELLDSIINKYGEKTKKIVYRGIRDDGSKDSLYKKILKCSKKRGNKLEIETFQSTSLNINTSLNFMGFKTSSILMEIDTNLFPYFYLPWDLNMKTLKKEIISGSEFELLLQRNVVMKYEGKKKILSDKSNIKNWNNYNKKKKFKLKEMYIYKFKIIDIIKDKKREKQYDITIPISELKNLYYIK